jgi:hypothetical protein
MAAVCKLCAPCKETFRGISREYLLSPEAYEYRAHHQSLRSFLEAVEQKCFICSWIWRYIDEEYRAAYLKDHTLSLSITYRLYISKSEENSVVRLGVRHYSPILSETQDIKFCLIPCKGLSILCSTQQR